ncbi:hypothetical protein N9X61_01250 [Sulfurimonas sp.]|nr:hypothetical protein [Sulfurimonas sp.]
MAYIVWKSEEECWCADCGQQGIISCSCEECEVCGEYTEGTDYRDDVKDANIVCYSCYNELEELGYCEYCDLQDNTVTERPFSEYELVCDECYINDVIPDKVNLKPSVSSIQELQQLASI